MIDRENIKKVFMDYVSDYDISDPKIKLKVDHTFRVANLCERIGKTVNSDADLLWLCGVLHDIGRFEQVRRFNTFSDAISVDHALLGSKLLFEDGLIESFGSGLDNNQLRIIKLAVSNHSLYRIERGLSDVEKTYCNILRDADKIDIFRVNCDTPLKDIYNFTTDEFKKSQVGDDVKNCFINRTSVLRSLKKYPADYIVGHICLVFELVYPISTEIAKEQGYVDKLLSFQSDNEDTKVWFDYMKKNIWEQ